MRIALLVVATLVMAVATLSLVHATTQVPPPNAVTTKTLADHPRDPAFDMSDGHLITVGPFTMPKKNPQDVCLRVHFEAPDEVTVSMFACETLDCLREIAPK